MALRRARGVLLRLVRRRATAMVVGVLLMAPAAWMQLRGSGAWWQDGLSLVLGATGAAVLWMGIAGARPDWIDEGTD